MADALGVSRATVSFIETGKQNPTIKELQRLAQLYKIPVAELLGDYSQYNQVMEGLGDAICGLSENDRIQVIRFAQFLQNAGPPPR